LTERGGGFVAGVDSACPPREVLPLGRSAVSRRACICLKLSEARWKGPAHLGRPAYRRLFRQPSLSFGVFHDVENPASFSPQRSRPPATRRGLLRRSSRRRNGLPLSQSRLHVGFLQSTPAPPRPVSLALSSAPYGPPAIPRPAWRRRLVSSLQPPRCGSSIWVRLYSA
jgi:hypothetical protein